MRWEYQRLTIDITEIPGPTFDAKLAALGQEGWELTAAVHHEVHGHSHDVHLLFKRRVG